MFKAYIVKTNNDKVNGVWKIEISKNSNDIYIKKPMPGGKMDTARKVSPGYNGVYNQYFHNLPDVEKLVIEKLIQVASK